MGCGARRSHQRKTPNTAMPPKNESRITGSLQPRRGSSISANTGPARPSAQSSPPITSTLARRALVGSLRGTAIGDECHR